MSDYSRALTKANVNIGAVNRAITKLSRILGLDLTDWQRVLMRNVSMSHVTAVHRVKAHPYRIRRHWGPARHAARRARLEERQ